VTRRIVWSPEAERDAIEIAAFIGQDHRAAALRFFDAIEATLEELIAMPGAGRAFPSRQPAIAQIRFRPINGFRNYLIFYRVIDSGIAVVRIVHGARDLPALFDPPR
jgi:toxin ParE1/3/4